MLSCLGEYIANDIITLYYLDYAILYQAEGTKQVKTIFINRYNYTGYIRLLFFIPSILTFLKAIILKML